MNIKFVKALSLYIDGEAVDVPKKPTWDGDLVRYRKGMDVRLGKAVLGRELTWIRIQDSKGNETLLCDRCLMNFISRKDCESLSGYEIEEDGIRAVVDLPTVGMSGKDDCDWIRAFYVAEGSTRLHWKKIYSIGRETWIELDTKKTSLRGFSGARDWGYSGSNYNYSDIGWRPALRVLDTDSSSDVHMAGLYDVPYFWYTESWDIDDLANSLRENGIPVTENNVQAALSVVKKKKLFEDLSERRELLDAVIREHFKK